MADTDHQRFHITVNSSNKLSLRQMDNKHKDAKANWTFFTSDSVKVASCQRELFLERHFNTYSFLFFILSAHVN